MRRASIRDRRRCGGSRAAHPGGHPAGNVLEHIARHDLENSADGAFGPRDLLCASEIAFVTDDVMAMASAIRARFALPQYRPASEAFAAIGDEQGLLLVFRRGRNIGFGSRPEVRASVYPTDVAIDGPGESARYEADGYPFSIASRTTP